MTRRGTGTSGGAVEPSTRLQQLRLTFDDGPDDATIPILALLARYKLSATFFVIGRKAQDTPELVRRAHAEGHEIGNHTWDHPRLALLPETSIRDQIERTSELIANLTGTPPRSFRAPFAETSPTVDTVVRSLRLAHVPCEIGVEDWRCPPAGVIDERIRRARAGAIIVLHDGGDTSRANTVAGLAAALEAIERDG